MTSAQQRLIGVAECLPKLSLPRADSPGTISWCQGTQASVLFFPHPGSCPACARYLAELNQIGDDLRQWATRLLVVVAAGAHEVEVLAQSTSTLLADEDSAARKRVGVSDNDVAVIVADRYGAVYQVSAAGADHLLPDPRALVELATFIDIQCPECGVPGPEWSLACPLPLG